LKYFVFWLLLSVMLCLSAFANDELGELGTFEAKSENFEVESVFEVEVEETRKMKIPWTLGEVEHYIMTIGTQIEQTMKLIDDSKENLINLQKQLIWYKEIRDKVKAAAETVILRQRGGGET